MDNPVQNWLRQTDRYYGWYVVAICFLLTFMTFGTIYSYTVFFDPIQRRFGASHVGTSLLFSIQSFVTFGSGAVLGFAVDRYRTRHLLGCASGLLVGGLVGASALPSFPAVLVAYAVVAGLGLGIVYIVSYTTPPRWFHRQRGFATGIAVSGTGGGILVFPPVIATLIAVAGWRTAYLVIALVFAGVLLCAMAILTDRPRTVGVASQAANHDNSHPGRETGSSAGALRTPAFGLVFVALLLGFVPSYAVAVYLVEFAQSTGISRRVGVAAVSIYGAASFVVKFAVGRIADRRGTVPTMSVCLGAMSAATMSLAVFPAPATILLFAGLLGLGFGGVDALLTPLLAELFGSDNLGGLFGVTAVAFAVTGLVVPLAVGFGFDRLGSYQSPFLLAAVLGALAVPPLHVAKRL